MTTTPVPPAAAVRDAGAVVPKRTRPITWWAAIGFGFLAFAAYLVVAWLLAGEAHRVPPGPTPLPVWMEIALSIQQWGLFAGMLALIWFKAIRPRLRDGSVPFDGLMVLSFALLWWSDPLYNYFTPGFNYNAYFVNLGSWVGHVPGWMSPHPENIPQPLLWLPGVYTCAFFSMVLIVNAIFRKTALRGDAWPQDVQQRSYFTSGVCGPATDVACPDPRVPFPRGESSLRIAPDATLVTPAGTTPLTAPTQSTTP